MAIYQALDRKESEDLFMSLPFAAQMRIVSSYRRYEPFPRLAVTKIAREFVPTLKEAVGIADAVIDGMQRI